MFDFDPTETTIVEGLVPKVSIVVDLSEMLHDLTLKRSRCFPSDYDAASGCSIDKRIKLLGPRRRWHH